MKKMHIKDINDNKQFINHLNNYYNDGENQLNKYSIKTIRIRIKLSFIISIILIITFLSV